MINAKANIHNKFDIEVRDSITDEIKQKITAYNIVLNNMWNKLCNLQAYFSTIHFGTGTGTLSPTRTSLFVALGSKSVVNDTLVKSFPVSYWKRKIVLNPEDYVGSNITEVGIGYSSTLLTHAMLKDAEGNSISILKTATDVVTIYATIYVTFDTGDNDKIKLSGMPNNNPLVNYLIGGASFGSTHFYLGQNGEGLSEENRNTLGSLEIAKKYIESTSWIADIANKKVSTPTMRFGTSEGNGHIKEIGLGGTFTQPIFRSTLPIPSIFPGQTYSDVPIGIGDGVTKEFLLPSRNIKQDTINIKVNAINTLGFTASKFSQGINYMCWPPQFDTSYRTSRAVAMSENANVLVNCYDTDNSGFISYSWNGAFATRLPDPVDFPDGRGVQCALSSDGNVMAIANYNYTTMNNGLPSVYVYDWDGNAWIKRINPPSLPKCGTGVGLSSDGKRIVVCGAYTASGGSNGAIAVYDWDGNTWTKTADPVVTSKISSKCVLTHDGKTLALIVGSSPFVVEVHDWDGTNWIKRGSSPSLANIASLFLTKDGKTLACSSSSTMPMVQVYDWDGNAWIKRADPSGQSGYSNACVLVNDGKRLIAGFQATNYWMMWDWNGTAWIKNSDSTSRPWSAGTVYGMGVGGNEKYVLFSTSSVPYLAIANIEKLNTSITFDTAPAVGSAITATYLVEGIHKTDQYVLDVGVSLQFGEVI